MPHCILAHCHCPLATARAHAPRPPTASPLPAHKPYPRPYDRASFSLQSCSCSSSEHAWSPAPCRQPLGACGWQCTTWDHRQISAVLLRDWDKRLHRVRWARMGQVPQPLVTRLRLCLAQAKSSQVRSGPVRSSQVRSGQVQSGQVRSSQGVQSSQV